MDTPTFVTNTLHVITALSIPFHIFGAYCILFKTPKTMRSVKWIMLNFHIWCMILDYSVSILTVPYILFPVMGGYPLGLLRDLGVHPSIQVYFIMILLTEIVVTIITIFENRFFQVFASNSTWRHFRIPFLGFNYIFASLWPLPSFLHIPDQSTALPQAMEKLPNLPEYVQEESIYIVAIDHRVLVYPTVAAAVFLGGEAYLFTIKISWCMRNAMKTTKFSQATLNLQKKFLGAIYIQAAVLLLIIQLPAIYICISVLFDIYCPTANNFCFITFAIHGPVSTIVMLYTHKPYRDYCIHCFINMKCWILCSPEKGSNRKITPSLAV